MFEQDVAGLIKALRANKNDEQSVIEQALEECRKEIKQSDIDLKAAAVLKLVYLEMLGYSISFASFAIVECMTSTKYHIKSIGYLAASQAFDKETEVAVLVVNLVKKDLLSPPTGPLFSPSPSSLTVAHLLSVLSSVSLLLTPTLARDLAPDVLSLLSHTRPQVRKQTVLVAWRILRSWPGVQDLTTGREERGEDPWVARLRERLGDEDMGVVAATVNLICEGARKEPRKYLPLAPELFGLLTGSTNNWMLIKIVKLFAVLTPHEPRLVRKLVPPLTELINTTPAMSLLYECIQTSIVGGMLTDGREGDALAATCVEKLSAFLTDADQNLRYIALVALVKILPTHPELLSSHHDTILACVDDPDMSIRLRALDLVEGMVDRSSLRPIVTRLMTHLRPSAQTTVSAASHLAAHQAANGSAGAGAATPAVLSVSYRSSLIALILRVCAQSTYQLITNFQWYLDILVELAHLGLGLTPEASVGEHGVAPVSVGGKVRDQLVDVTARVKAIRPYAVKKMASLLEDEAFLEAGEAGEGAAVLEAAAWICGEYCRELQDPRPVIASLFGSSTSSALPPRILASYIHNGVKVYAAWLAALADNWDEADLVQIRSVTGALEAQLAECAGSEDVELQERAAELGQALELVRGGLDAPRPVGNGAGFGSEGREPDEDAEMASLDRPALPPACLGILGPCFFGHELNPVNPKAQGMVGLPEGLDLDVEIVAGSSREWYAMQEESEREGGAGEVDDFGRPTARAVAAEQQARLAAGAGASNGRKGKKGAKSGGGRKGKGREVEEDQEELARLKVERLERQRDDPYYVGTAPGALGDEDDVDSIPIVALSLDFNAPSGQQQVQPPPREPTPPPVFIDVEGEMPEGPLRAVPRKEEVVVEVVVEEKGVDEEAREAEAVEGKAVKVVKKKKKAKVEGEEKTKKKKKPKQVALQ